jgi:pyruvate formate lyase activating enzyme
VPGLKTVAVSAGYICAEPRVEFFITTLLIPGENDSPAELEGLSRWVMDRLGPDVPLHFTAFHPDWKMLARCAAHRAGLVRPYGMVSAR